MDVTTGTESPLRFGSFELDVRSRELRTGAGSVRLQEQPFEILRMMLDIAWLVHAKAVTGDRQGALDRLAHWHKLDRNRYLSPYHLAIAHVGLGNVEEAFESLETAAVARDPGLAFIAVEPRFAPLRSNPRYGRLVDLLGL